MARVKNFALLVLIVVFAVNTAGCFPASTYVFEYDEEPDTSQIAFYPAGDPNESGRVRGYGSGNFGEPYYYYKIDADGREIGELRQFPHAGSGYSVVGDWVYYTDYSATSYLYRMRVDGTEGARLNSDISIHAIAVGDWIYYQNNRDNGYIYRMRTDGTMKTRLNDDIQVDGDADGRPVGNNSFMIVAGEWIYYLKTIGKESDSAGSDLYRIRVDGTGKTHLTNDIDRFDVSGDFIYYINVTDDCLYKAKLDGTAGALIGDGIRAEYVTVVGDWIYYISADNGFIYRVHTDGSGMMQLNDVFTPGYGGLNVVGDWIYYHDGTKEYRDYKVRIDGTENQLIELG